MRVNQKQILIASEAILPLLGFFVWEWSLYFILLFYAFDMLAQEGIMYLKSIRINQVQELKKQNWSKYAVMSLVVLISFFVLLHTTMVSMQPKISFIEQLSAFWNYEDLGLKQGYFLLPLVGLSAYQNYKMTFLMRGSDRTESIQNIWRKHIQALLIGVGFSGFAIGLNQIFIIPEFVYVVAIVTGVAGFSFIFKR